MIYIEPMFSKNRGTFSDFGGKRHTDRNMPSHRDAKLFDKNSQNILMKDSVKNFSTSQH